MAKVSTVQMSIARRLKGLRRRFFPADPKIVAFTVRKSGSHLLGRLLDLVKIPHDVEHLLYLHKLMPALAGNVPLLVLIRDPRDVLVSGVFWHTDRWPQPGVYGQPLDGKEAFLDADNLSRWNAATFDEKLTMAIEHEMPLPYSQINREYELARNTLAHPRSMLVKFEDLVGDAGGGSNVRQREVVDRICSLVGMRGSPDFDRIRKHLFGSSDTFRKGRIGGWREHFQSVHVALFERHMGHLLDEWRYR